MSAEWTLHELVQTLRVSRGFTHKRDIGDVTGVLARALPGGLGDTTLAASQGIGLGDDCAVIPDADGHLLFAIEGLVEDFVEQMPWFAGYSAVMVNLSDVAAMGGARWPWWMRSGVPMPPRPRPSWRAWPPPLPPMACPSSAGTATTTLRAGSWLWRCLGGRRRCSAALRRGRAISC
jgi:hypothetical protein